MEYGLSCGNEIITAINLVTYKLCFLKSQKNILKAQRGTTLSTQGVYKWGLGGGGEKEEKIRKTNHPRGQPACCPREKSKKKKVEKILNRPRGVLKISIVSLTPNTPHNTNRDHFPHNSAFVTYKLLFVISNGIGHCI
jgi:hypothetical protein